MEKPFTDAPASSRSGWLTRRRLTLLAVTLGFGLSLFLNFRILGKTEYGNYHEPVCADAAGYYVYLPAVFIYGWDFSAFPPDAAEKTCGGFSIEGQGENARLRDKYTVGMAILVAPFFLLLHLGALLLGLPTDGFNLYYQTSTILAACFYGWLGITLLFHALRRQFSFWASFWAAGITAFGTSVFYYINEEVAYSHVYTFFGFCALAWLVPRLVAEPRKPASILLTGAAVGIMVAIRPLSVPVIALVGLLAGVGTWADLKTRLRWIVRNPVPLLLALVIAFICFFPQMLYWKYASGHWVWDSYEGESFNRWDKAAFGIVWFDLSSNGLFVWHPLMLLFVGGLFVLAWKRLPNAWLGLLAFFFVSYYSAAWHMPDWGCSLGMRNMVDVTGLLAFGIAAVVESTRPVQRSVWRHLFWTFAVLLIALNFRLYARWDACFGKQPNEHAFTAYLRTVFSTKVVPFCDCPH